MQVRWIAIGITTLTLAACGQWPSQPAANVTSLGPSAAASPTAQSSSTPLSSPAPSPTAVTNNCSVPQPLSSLCVGRAATDAEKKAMLSAGEMQLYADFAWADCSAATSMQSVCFKASEPSRAIVGTHAGVFAGQAVDQNQKVLYYCVVFVIDNGGWSGLGSWCMTDNSQLSTALSRVEVGTSCANVRSAAGTSGKVVDCLRSDTEVKVDSAPTYADGYMWWHLAGRGWIAHDFLYAPSHVA